jgi:hypothetical protein
MRDLRNDELGHIYGAGGRSCAPPPSSCNPCGTRGRSTGGHGSKGHKSGGHKGGSKGRC